MGDKLKLSVPACVATMLFTALLLMSCSTSTNEGRNDEDIPGETMLIDLNGDYAVDVALDAASEANPDCNVPTGGTITVTGTTISGVVNETLDVDGTINSDGTISGGFAFEGGSRFADYSGMVNGSELNGTWVDIFGCSGTWSATKIET